MTTMSGANYESAIAHALNILEHHIAPMYVYHDVWHTREDVMPQAARLAQLCGCTPEQIELVHVAAAYHDLGFIETDRNHELAGVRIAAQMLPQHGFDARYIEAIIGMILATRLPQDPRTLLEMIVADADLDVLGRDDFFERNLLLRQELSARGFSVDDTAWYKSQLAFLESHTYFTEAAQQMRRKGKQHNIAALRRLLTDDHART